MAVRTIAHEPQQIRLAFCRRLEEVAPLQDMDPTGAAAGAAAAERDWRAPFVAEVEQSASVRCVHLERRMVGRFEHDDRHARNVYRFSSKIACSARWPLRNAAELGP
jgi:hypothetical protein